MNGAVQIFPNQSVMFYIFDEIFLSDVAGGQIFDSINRNNAYVFNCP